MCGELSEDCFQEWVVRHGHGLQVIMLACQVPLPLSHLNCPLEQLLAPGILSLMSEGKGYRHMSKVVMRRPSGTGERGERSELSRAEKEQKVLLGSGTCLGICLKMCTGQPTEKKHLHRSAELLLTAPLGPSTLGWFPTLVLSPPACLRLSLSHTHLPFLLHATSMLPKPGSPWEPAIHLGLSGTEIRLSMISQLKSIVGPWPSNIIHGVCKL